MEPEHTDTVAHNVDDIGGDGQVHGGAGLSKAAVKGRPGIVHGQRHQQLLQEKRNDQIS